MKKLLVLSAIFFPFIHISSGQAYRPFLNDSAHWTIEEDYCLGYTCDPANAPGANDCFVTSIYSFKLGGDTIVDSFVYKKLIQYIVTTVNTGSNSPCFWPVPSKFANCGVVGLLWEDTNARKVYIRKTNYPTSKCWQDQDSLFFDFSLQIGDTMKIAASCLSALADSFYAVDSINYIGFNQYPVKTWYLHCLQDSNDIAWNANIKLYESIGASVGFFGYQPLFEGLYSSQLDSYFIGSDSAAGFSCMNPYLGITSLSTQDISILVYPNPAKGTLTLDMVNMSPGGNLRFVLADIVGQKVRSEIIMKAKMEIDISALSSGIYLWYVISDENIIRSGKVVRE